MTEGVEDRTGLRWRMERIAALRGGKRARLVKVFIDPVRHIRAAPKPLQGWYKARGCAGRERTCMTEALLLAPYAGLCPVRCVYCYLNHGTRGYQGAKLTTAPVDYGGFVRRELVKVKTSPAGYLSSFTDPFNVLESVYHNTEAAARAFVGRLDSAQPDRAGRGLPR
jgi:hypothetical protein